MSLLSLMSLSLLSLNSSLVTDVTNVILPLQQGGTAGFLQMFLLEATSMATQTVRVLGGNSVVNYKVNDCMLQDSPHKNQVMM